MASNENKKVKGKVVKKSGATAADAKITALHTRVAKLEKHFKVASRLGLLTAAVSTDGGEPLIFSLRSGGPSIVRLTLDHAEQLVLGSGPVSSAPRASGTLVSVLIELWGSPGQQAVIDVTNAEPSDISSTIPPGRSDWSEPRTLKVS